MEEPVVIEGPLTVLGQVVLGREEQFAARVGGTVAGPGFVRWSAGEVEMVGQADLVRLYYLVAELEDTPKLPLEFTGDWAGLLKLWRHWLPVTPLHTRIAVRGTTYSFSLSPPLA